MGQLCIELNVDMMGLVLALVIAIALLLSCVNQPSRPRRPMAVTHRSGTHQTLILSEMGKVICSELKEGNTLDLTGFLMVLAIALTLMAICFPPPPRRVVLVARRFG